MFFPPMKTFEFATATRILFGAGVVREAPAAARSLGERPLIVTGSSGKRGLALDGVAFSVAAEPVLQAIRQGAEIARDARCDVVVAIGGGSAIDTGKALAALLTNPGDPLDYLEVIGQGRPIAKPPAPFIAIPTTAGTGSEVTRNAVLASPEHRVKASLRSPMMLPTVAIVDPELTYSLPPHLTASTGLDALTQLIEPYVSVRANPMTDMICLEGLRHAAGNLERACAKGSDADARTAMSWASLLGGMALANAALGAVHGFAAPIGGMFDAPHGAVCAAVLPHAMEVNLRALGSRASGGEALERYRTVAQILTGDPQAAAEDGVRWIAALCGRLEIPPLRAYGVSSDHVADLAAKAAKASSMKGNPIVLTGAELEEIASRAI
jgi:alcohol dehydrogenase class IV